MNKDEALKLALEALESVEGVGTVIQWKGQWELCHAAINAIQEALAAAQPEQPIDPMRKHVEDFARKCGWEPSDGEGAFECVQRASYEQGLKDGHEKGNPRLQKIGPLYASPPKHQPLTDEEILKFGSAANISHDKTVCDVKFARAIEAAHGIKEKNT